MGAELDAAEPLLNDAQPTCAPLIQIHELPFKFSHSDALKNHGTVYAEDYDAAGLFWEYFAQKLHLPRCLRGTGRTWAGRDGGRRVLTRRRLGHRFDARAFMIALSRAVLSLIQPPLPHI